MFYGFASYTALKYIG